MVTDLTESISTYKLPALSVSRVDLIATVVACRSNWVRLMAGRKARNNCCYFCLFGNCFFDFPIERVLSPTPTRLPQTLNERYGDLTTARQRKNPPFCAPDIFRLEFSLSKKKYLTGCHTVYTVHIQMFVISQTDKRPMYLQIMEQMKQRIAVGDWAAGQAIPSIRHLAADIGVSVITVKRAYLELEREGVIVTRQGKGCFVASDSEVGTRIREQELAQHLEQAVRSASMMGLSPKNLEKRIREIYGRVMDEEKETV